MQGMKIANQFVMITLTLIVLVGLAAAKDPVRPPITGVAWIGLRTADMDATKKFYTGYLGMQELPGVTYDGDGGLTRVVFKVNNMQFIQVLPELKDPKQNRLIDIAFLTTNVGQLRDYLASKGVAVPDHMESTSNSTGTFGATGFAITDPAGHVIKFVQLTRTIKIMSGKTTVQTMEKPADNNVSDHMIHTGFIVHDRAAEDHLFKDILGFTETWHGGMTDDKTSWIDMRVPDGKDWLEYMMDYDDNDVRISGIMNHLALGVPSVAEGYDTVVKRGLNPEKPKIGRDGKWQLNLYGPDQTRVELMEPKPVQTPCCSPMVQ